MVKTEATLGKSGGADGGKLTKLTMKETELSYYSCQNRNKTRYFVVAEKQVVSRQVSSCPIFCL